MSDTPILIADAATRLPGLTDAEFLREIPWRNSSPRRLTSAAQAGDVEEFIRRLPLPPEGRALRRDERTLPGILHPIWSRNSFEGTSDVNRTVKTLVKLNNLSRKPSTRTSRTQRIWPLIEDWLREHDAPTSHPFATLVTLTLFSELAGKLTGKQAFRLWRATLTHAVSTISASRAMEESDDVTFDQRLIMQGEIPWRAGLLFGNVRESRKLLRAGRALIRESLEESTDTDGTPHARYLQRLPLAIACYVRASCAARAFEKPLWDSETTHRFHCLIERSSALCQPDGRLALSNGASFASVSLLRTASVLAGLKTKDAAVQRLMILPDDSPATRKRRRMPHRHEAKRGMKNIKAERPSSQSDWAELICLRNNWLPGSDCCVITHDQLDTRINLTAFDTQLLEGSCPTVTRIGGTVLGPQDAWECVCWFSDEDADYIELERKCERDVTHLRQLLLSRTDHFLFIADTIQTTDPQPLTHELRLPLAENVEFAADSVTRQLTLSRERMLARVYPLALEQSRVIRAHGRFDADGKYLTLEQSTEGTGLHVPLVIDWSPERRRQTANWRMLTVAERGAPVSRSHACSYRLRVGKHQWVFYHSLQRPQVPRSVIGQHMAYETLIGEFTSQGDVDPLVMVE